MSDKTPATRALVNLSKALLDDANAECEELRGRVAKLEAALTESRRFMDYFANDRHEFVGPGTPLSRLAHIDWALNPDAAPKAPAERSGDSICGGAEEKR